MLKLLIGICIVAFSTICGYIFASKYRKRKAFFTQFHEFNERFLSEVSYYRRPLCDFIANYPYTEEFSELLQEYYLAIKENALFDRDVLDLDQFSFLTEDEKVIINDYFLMLGRGDSASQKGYFSTMKNTLSKLQIQTMEEGKRYGDLYIKLGFLGGLLVLLLIV